MVAGVYKIVNKKNNKVYIGSSNDLQRRKYEHFNDLKNKNHVNKHLQSAYNKYGVDVFDFIILEFVPDLGNLQDREQYWMDYYNSYDDTFGYNILQVAEGRRVGAMSAETKKKISDSKKALGLIPWNKGLRYKTGIPRSEATKKKISAALKGMKRGPMTTEQKEFRRKWNIEHGHTPPSAKGRVRSLETRKKISDANRRRPRLNPGEHTDRYGTSKFPPIKIIFADGKEYIYNSIRLASDNLNISYSSIRSKLRVPFDRQRISPWRVMFVDTTCNS